MTTPAPSWLKSLAVAVLAAIAGSAGTHFYQQGERASAFLRIESDLLRIEREANTSLERVDRMSATRRLESREEFLLLHNTQQRDIDVLRDEINAMRNR